MPRRRPHRCRRAPPPRPPAPYPAHPNPCTDAQCSFTSPRRSWSSSCADRRSSSGARVATPSGRTSCCRCGRSRWVPCPDCCSSSGCQSGSCQAARRARSSAASGGCRLGWGSRSRPAPGSRRPLARGCSRPSRSTCALAAVRAPVGVSGPSRAYEHEQERRETHLVAEFVPRHLAVLLKDRSLLGAERLRVRTPFTQPGVSWSSAARRSPACGPTHADVHFRLVLQRVHRSRKGRRDLEVDTRGEGGVERRLWLAGRETSSAAVSSVEIGRAHV